MSLLVGDPKSLKSSVSVLLHQKHLIFQKKNRSLCFPQLNENFTSFENFKTGIFQKAPFSPNGYIPPPLFSNQKNPTLWEKLGRGPESDQGVCWEDQPPKKSPFGYHLRTLLQNPPTQQTIPSAGSRQKGWVRSHGGPPASRSTFLVPFETRVNFILRGFSQPPPPVSLGLRTLRSP